MAPVDTNSENCLDALFEYAHGLVYSAANDATVSARIEVFSTVPKTPHKIQQLEEIHKIADLYLWLSIRYPSYFPDHDHVREIGFFSHAVMMSALSWCSLAFRNQVQEQRLKCASLIDQGLEQLTATELAKFRKMAKTLRKRGGGKGNS